MRNAWNVQNRAAFMEVAQNLFVVKFLRNTECNRVLYGGPWNYMGAVIPMKRRVKGMQPRNVVLERISIWLQIHNLPLEVMLEKVARKVAAVAGSVIRVNELTGDVVSCKYMRVKVELSINEHLVTSYCLQISNEGPVWLDFKYEHLLKFYFHCGVFNHFTTNCVNGPRQGESGGEFSPSLRAMS
ncbi:hypothetical protein QQ045_028852 [Rhodiola kirilowii]